MLSYFTTRVVHLQKIAYFLRCIIVAARVPDVAAKDERITGVCEHDFGAPAVPVCFCRSACRPVTAGNDARRCKVAPDISKIELYRQYENRSAGRPRQVATRV